MPAKEKVAKKKKRENFRGKMVELTFSRCETPPEEVLKHFEECFGERLRRYQIVQETHSGEHGPKGMHHLHCFLQFDKVTSVPMIRLKKKMGQRPHFSTIKNPASFLGYIAKENKPLGNFDIFEEAWSYPGKKDMLVKSMFNAGWTASQVISKYSDHLWTEDFGKYVRKLDLIRNAEALAAYDGMPGLKHIDREMIEENLTTEELAQFDSFEGFQRLINHLNDIEKYSFQQPHRPLQNLLVVSRTAMGKTMLFREVMKYVPTYEFPIDDWHPDYEDGVYKLILWDEPKLRHGLAQTYLKLLDGLTCNLPVKGSRAVRKDHQKIVMLSNETKDELTKAQRIRSPDSQEAFKRRLDEINFGDRSLVFLIKLIYPKDAK